MRRAIASALILLFSAGIVAGHSGAKGVVKQRMDGMKELSGATKALGAIKAGAIPFSPDVIRRAAGQLAEHGEAARALFPEGSLTGTSEALEEIWVDRQGFDRMLEEMITAAGRLDSAAEDQEEALQIADEIAETCKACHAKYRKRKL